MNPPKDLPPPISPRKKPFRNGNRSNRLNQRQVHSNEIKANNIRGNSQTPSRSRHVRAYTTCARLPTLVSAIPISTPTHNHISPHRISTLCSARPQSPIISESRTKNKCAVTSVGRQDIQLHRSQMGIQHIAECHETKTQKLLKNNQLLAKPRVHRLTKPSIRMCGVPLTYNSFTKGKRQTNPIVGNSASRSDKLEPYPDTRCAAHAEVLSPFELLPERAIFSGPGLGDGVTTSSANIFTYLQGVSEMLWAPLDDQEKEYLEQRKELPRLFRCMLEEMERVGPNEICNRGPNAAAAWMLEWLTNAQRHCSKPISGFDEISKDTEEHECEGFAGDLGIENNGDIVALKAWGLSSSSSSVNNKGVSVLPLATDPRHLTDNKAAVSNSQKLLLASSISADHSSNGSTVWNAPPVAVATAVWLEKVFPELICCLTPESSCSATGLPTTSSDDATPLFTPKEASYLPSELRSASRQAPKSPTDIAEQSFLNHLQLCLNH
ncbi:unnamed protein product [Phytomonas sp. Hart1]|nr:unnamed protein product [Phytomonas sp. Hart1]|eukprot:CCW70365.1 unnamed protein product [Phytomonas sp. isolate Hart1]